MRTTCEGSLQAPSPRRRRSGPVRRPEDTHPAPVQELAAQRRGRIRSFPLCPLAGPGRRGGGACAHATPTLPSAISEFLPLSSPCPNISIFSSPSLFSLFLSLSSSSVRHSRKKKKRRGHRQGCYFHSFSFFAALRLRCFCHIYCFLRGGRFACA